MIQWATLLRIAPLGGAGHIWGFAQAQSAANDLPYTSQVALGLFGALTKLKSAANDLPYTTQVALGLFGQCNAQARKINGEKNEKNNGCIVKADSMKSA